MAAWWCGFGGGLCACHDACFDAIEKREAIEEVEAVEVRVAKDGRRHDEEVFLM